MFKYSKYSTSMIIQKPLDNLIKKKFAENSICLKYKMMLNKAFETFSLYENKKFLKRLNLNEILKSV